MDAQSEQLLQGVSPDLAARVRALAATLAARNITIRVKSAKRSTVQQAALYANRANNPYPVAVPGTSLHEQGRAVDLAIVGRGTWAEVGSAGEAVGLRWGGRFSKPDPVHFELQAGTNTATSTPSLAATPTPSSTAAPAPNYGWLVLGALVAAVLFVD